MMFRHEEETYWQHWTDKKAKHLKGLVSFVERYKVYVTEIKPAHSATVAFKEKIPFFRKDGYFTELADRHLDIVEEIDRGLNLALSSTFKMVDKWLKKMRVAVDCLTKEGTEIETVLSDFIVTVEQEIEKTWPGEREKAENNKRKSPDSSDEEESLEEDPKRQTLLTLGNTSDIPIDLSD